MIEEPRPTSLPRTVQRIVLETLFIGLLGAFVLGTVWEFGYPRLAWAVGAAIWILGDPILEIGRLWSGSGRPK
jgi:hypothetical protein